MVNIRKAIAQDIDTLYDLIMGIAKHHGQEAYVKTTKEEMLAAGFGENPQFGALLAEVDGKAAGYLSYTWNYSIWNGAEYMNLDDLFVWPEFRSQKVGLKLMEAAKALCAEKSVHAIRWEVESNNAGAIKFYQRLGAIMTEKGIFKWNLNT